MTSTVNQLPAVWNEVRAAARAEDQSLTGGVFDLVTSAFKQRARSGISMADLTPEWGKAEFLRVVDVNGEPARASSKAWARCRSLSEQFPAFTAWVRLEEPPGGKEPLFLAARWLCHLAGLRHLTVEIRVDPPSMPGFTLAQVRGVDKVEAPGCFDIPCAGHVSGLDGIEESLAKELGEELNLAPADLDRLALAARYNSIPRRLDTRLLNYEYRFLYQAVLNPASVSKIRFTDGEVAGLCVFPLAALKALASAFPERFATGLSDAIGYY